MATLKHSYALNSAVVLSLNYFTHTLAAEFLSPENSPNFPPPKIRRKNQMFEFYTERFVDDRLTDREANWPNCQRVVDGNQTNLIVVA